MTKAEPEHGTTGRYRRNCRCDACRAAMSAYNREYRNRNRDAILAQRAAARANPAPVKDDEHGTYSAYNRGCRCEECKTFRNAWHRDYRDRNRDSLLPKRRAHRLHLKTAPVPEGQHGTRNGYEDYGCRCQPCRDAKSACAWEYYRRDVAKTREIGRARVKAWREAHPERFGSDVVRARWLEQRDELMAYLGGACVDCGTTDLRFLQFDHLDVEAKTAGIYSLARRYGFDSLEVLQELEICALRCANCHQIKTAAEGDLLTGRARAARIKAQADPPTG